MAKTKLSKAKQLALKQQQELLKVFTPPNAAGITEGIPNYQPKGFTLGEGSPMSSIPKGQNLVVSPPMIEQGTKPSLPIESPFRYSADAPFKPIKSFSGQGGISGTISKSAKPFSYTPPIIEGTAPSNYKPLGINYKSSLSAGLPNIQGIESRIGNYRSPSVEGLGSRIMNNPITKAISNEIEYAKPFAKAGGTALGVIGAGNLAYGAYQANKDELQTDQIQATKLGDSIKGYHLDNTKPAIDIGSFGNPLDNLDYAYRANKVNNDLIQQTSVLPTKQPIPVEASNGYTPIGRKPSNSLNQFLYPGIQQSPVAQNISPTEQLQQPQISNNVTNPTSVKGISSWVDPTTKQITYGNTGFTPNQEGTILNNGAEGRTTINGKVDKNSDFYKRNKQAMHNLGGGWEDDQNALQIAANRKAQEEADKRSSINLRNFR